MNAETPVCLLCGEPMPPGEEMFKLHGWSSNCPKPPKVKPYSYDSKCEELADHFLQDRAVKADPNNRGKLSQHIQDAVEAWFWGREA